MKKFALFFSAAAVLCILAGLTAYHRSFPLDADLNGLEPAAWLKSTLEKLPTCLNSRIDELLPIRC